MPTALVLTNPPRPALVVLFLPLIVPPPGGLCHRPRSSVPDQPNLGPPKHLSRSSGRRLVSPGQRVPGMFGVWRALGGTRNRLRATGAGGGAGRVPAPTDPQADHGPRRHSARQGTGEIGGGASQATPG